MTNCIIPDCDSTEFQLKTNHEWVCKKCGLFQYRYNCGFYKCLKECRTMIDLQEHLEKEHIRK